MRLRASSEKKAILYFFTLGHSTENLHFYKKKFIYLLCVTHLYKKYK